MDIFFRGVQEKNILFKLEYENTVTANDATDSNNTVCRLALWS